MSLILDEESSTYQVGVPALGQFAAWWPTVMKRFQSSIADEETVKGVSMIKV